MNEQGRRGRIRLQAVNRRVTQKPCVTDRYRDRDRDRGTEVPVIPGYHL